MQQKQPWKQIYLFSRSSLSQLLLCTFSLFSTESWYQMHFSQPTSGATWWLLRSSNITARMHTLTHTCPGTCLTHHVPEHPSWLQHFQRQLFKGQRHRDDFLRQQTDAGSSPGEWGEFPRTRILLGHCIFSPGLEHPPTQKMWPQSQYTTEY